MKKLHFNFHLLTGLRNTRPLRLFIPLIVLLAVTGVVSADVPERVGVRGTVPNPGTQQQELGNITFPAPYNVFEFVVTCMACHGGTIDQQTAHGGNWAGTAMASAARDPVFRANQIIVNSAVTALTGEDGAGNMCFRCHSPNGWLSGRFDPTLNGAADGSTMIHSILLSTDDEGIMCETCHRTLGAVTFKRADLDPDDPVWNMMAGISDWPHSGGPYTDQEGDPTIAQGNPYGDTTLQFGDGMTYGARYPGYVKPWWSDIPLQPDPLGYMGYSPGGPYTGQTYGVYPPGWIDPQGNDVSGLPAFNPDGSLPVQYDVPIGPPINPNGTPCYNCQSVSLEHPTFGVSFVEEPEFCGSCHDLTVPVLNHGMPEQRTFTEWKFSAFGEEGPDRRTCQSCHMPRLSHEYSDDAPVTLNADPVVSGWFPYAKARVNTAVHKLAGANRDLPMMMQALYPEVDIEVIGGGEGANGVWVGTGNDPRIFPGMLSTRNSMWERNKRNTELSLRDGVDIQIVSGPTWSDALQRWQVQVKVINTTGHRIPSGYPDGRRMWIGLEVTDASGGLVYESGHYDAATATLFTDGSLSGLNRALEPVIDSANNAVMIYERVTGTCAVDETTGDLTGCTPSLSLLNDFILFDNRIPPAGFDYNQYRQAGVKFWNYDPATFVPFEDADRFAPGSNYDLITYTFTAPEGVVPAAVRAEVYWETHTREFMEHLRVSDTSTVRPTGPVRVWDPNYPLAPNYLSEEFGLLDIQDQMFTEGWRDPNGQVITLNDNWGGLSYAVWYATGRGAPFLAAEADTAAALPAAPGNVQVFPQCDPATGVCTGGVINEETNLLEPYTQVITWDAVPGADGYRVWIKYGPGATTASWDPLAVVYDDGDPATPLQLINTSININKTYVYKVEAFNGAGTGPASAEVSARTPWDLPLPPENLQHLSSTTNTITMTWYDASDNEIGWIIRRMDAPASNQQNFPEVARIPSDNPAGFGGVTFTDTGLAAGTCYIYVVEAYNTAGNSGWNVNGPVQMCTLGAPGMPIALSAAAISGTRVDLAWTPGTGTIASYRLERATDPGFTAPVVMNIADPAAVSYSDLSVAPETHYWYRLFAVNAAGTSPASNTVDVITPGVPPAAPSGLQATPTPPRPIPPDVTLTWTDNADNENGFYVERALVINGVIGPYAQIANLAAPSAGVGGTVTYVDGAVQPKVTYSYRVRAYNLVGMSEYSNAVQVVTPGQTPEAPSELRVTATSRNTVTLAWRDNSNNEQGFYVERSLNGTTWARVATLPANTTTYRNSGLTSNTTYYYRVQAYNADGVSAYSNTATARTRR